MPPQKVSTGHRCRRCGKTFTSLMRLRHHGAAEHAIGTSRDIPTTRDIRHAASLSAAPCQEAQRRGP